MLFALLANSERKTAFYTNGVKSHNMLFALLANSERKTAFCTNGVKSHNMLFALLFYSGSAKQHFAPMVQNR
jgi:hypothetical protein